MNNRSNPRSAVWLKRAEMRHEGLSVTEIAQAEGVSPQTISTGFRRMRKFGLDVPRSNGGGIKLRLLRVDHRTANAVAKFGKERGLGANDAANLILKTVVFEHPQIARNLLDPEA